LLLLRTRLAGSLGWTQNKQLVRQGAAMLWFPQPVPQVVLEHLPEVAEWIEVDVVAGTARVQPKRKAPYGDSLAYVRDRLLADALASSELAGDFSANDCVSLIRAQQVTPCRWRPTTDMCVLCCAVLCCAVLCCAVLCCAVLCCAVLCCAVLCCAVQQVAACCQRRQQQQAARGCSWAGWRTVAAAATRWACWCLAATVGTAPAQAGQAVRAALPPCIAGGM
jgi:hypothetical protein